MKRFAPKIKRHKSRPRVQNDEPLPKKSTKKTNIDIMYLQQTIGNQAVLQLMRENKLQRWVSATPSELEADEEESDVDTDTDEDLVLTASEIEQLENMNDDDSTSEIDTREELLLDPSEFENIENTNDNDNNQNPAFARTLGILDYQLHRIAEVDGLYDTFVSAINDQDYSKASEVFSDIISDVFGMFVDSKFSAYGGPSHPSDSDMIDDKSDEINELSADLREKLTKIVSEYKKHLEPNVINEYKDKKESFKTKAKDRKHAKKARRKKQISLSKKINKDVNVPQSAFGLLKEKRARKKEQKKNEKMAEIRKQRGY